MNIKKIPIKKIFLSTIITSIIITPVFSQTNITYDINGFCKNQEITISFYNESQYENKKKIEKELCSENENPDDDNCEKFDEIQVEGILYNGPTDKSEYIKSFYLYNNNYKIKHIFDKSNDYLLKINPDDEKIRNFEIIIPVEECKVYNDKLEEIEVEKELKIKQELEQEIEKIENQTNNNKIENITINKTLTIEEKILKENPGFILRNIELFQNITLEKRFSKFDRIRIFGILLIFIITIFKLNTLKKEHDRILK
jgi:hypothetical protein